MDPEPSTSNFSNSGRTFLCKSRSSVLKVLPPSPLASPLDVWAFSVEDEVSHDLASWKPRLEETPMKREARPFASPLFPSAAGKALICWPSASTNSSKSISPLPSGSASTIICCTSACENLELMLAQRKVSSSAEMAPDPSVSNLSKMGRTLARSFRCSLIAVEVLLAGGSSSAGGATTADGDMVATGACAFAGSSSSVGGGSGAGAPRSGTADDATSGVGAGALVGGAGFGGAGSG
mmetsp:Transcript_37683/g.75408  ORF Transcript_37683/g.75408 Transcript_37683/m.75408 type:complete len:237 (-) Transcript_37683:11-721(-)